MKDYHSRRKTVAIVFAVLISLVVAAFALFDWALRREEEQHIMQDDYPGNRGDGTLRPLVSSVSVLRSAADGEKGTSLETGGGTLEDLRDSA